MRTHTLLTTPPGEEPVAADVYRPELEDYSRALPLPHEPHVPGRFRRFRITFAILLVLAVGGYTVYKVTQAGQSFDPALDQQVDT